MNAPSTRARLAIAVAIALLSTAYVIGFAATNPDFTSDFDQVWGAARALIDGQDPYQVVGPGKLYPWRWPFYYPIPAAIVALPLALVPVVAARAIFAGASVGLLAWAVTRENYARLPLFLSISFVTAVELGQWSPLLTAAMLTPALGWLGVAKPNLGIAMGAYSGSNRSLLVMVAGAAALLAVSFVVAPGWAAEWIAAVRSAPHFRAPVTRPFGILLLLALLRWRRPEARMLCALALVPQTPTFYDHMFVFVAAKTSREALLLTVCTFVVYFVIGFNAPLPSFQAWGELLAKATVAFVYFPALVLILRRPNEGEVPAALERIVAAGRRSLAAIRS